MNSISDNKQMKRDKAVAFIVARLTSTRLRAKQFRKIGDRSIIDWVVTRLKQCEQVDEIVIATVAENENKPLIDYAKKQGIKSFWYEGDVDHVTTRLRRAAESFDAKICILISADCPLLYPPAIDDTILAMRGCTDIDVIGLNASKDGKPFMMQGVIVHSIDAWKKADDLSTTPELKEHQFPIIWANPKIFKRKMIDLNHNVFSEYRRISVDTSADLLFQNTLYNKLKEMGKEYSLPNALDILNTEPNLIKINSHVHQRTFGETEHNISIFIESTINIENMINIARTLIEKYGWVVKLFCDDNNVKAVLQNEGFYPVIKQLEEILTQHRGCNKETFHPNDECDIIVVQCDDESIKSSNLIDFPKTSPPIIQIRYPKNNSTEGVGIIYNTESKQNSPTEFIINSPTSVVEKIIKTIQIK